MYFAKPSSVGKRKTIGYADCSPVGLTAWTQGVILFSEVKLESESCGAVYTAYAVQVSVHCSLYNVCCVRTQRNFLCRQCIKCDLTFFQFSYTGPETFYNNFCKPHMQQFHDIFFRNRYKTVIISQ